MPFGLGFFAVAGAGVAAAGSYDLLQTEILTGSQASVTFSNLNSTYGADYQHLQIRGVVRATNAANDNQIYLRFNGSSGSYRWHFLKGNGSSVSSGTGTDNASRSTLVFPANNATANSFGAFVIDFLDPYSSNKIKVFRSLSGSASTTNAIELISGAWYTGTDAVTSILLGADAGGQFAIGSRFSLYGLRKAA